jgi:hypothetical protein
MRMLVATVALGLVVALGTGCQGGPEETVEITSPAPGEAVTVPFQVTVEASVPLGAPTEGFHHVHVWFGDDLESYLVVEDNVVEINYAPDGEHAMFVSLRNPDHSAAGVETSVQLVIHGGSTLDN